MENVDNKPKGVIAGDRIYVNHPKQGVISAPVIGVGKDGVTVKHADGPIGVRWGAVLGHHTRRKRRLNVVEHGEDGYIAEDESGKRVFVRGVLQADGEDEQADDGKVYKSMLMDVGRLSCGCTNHALESMHKAMSEQEINIWAKHESPFIQDLIEKFTENGLLKLDEIRAEIDRWISGQRHVRTLDRRPRPDMPMGQWTKKQLDLVKIYLDALPPSVMDLNDWSLLVDYLVQRYLPESELLSQAEWLVTKSHLMGKVEAYLHDTMTVQLAGSLIAALPLNIRDAVKAFKLSDATVAILEYGKFRACDAVTAVSESVRHGLKRVILAHQSRALAGDPEATPGALQSELLEKFAALNRDWRCIAVTEAGEMANQGVILSLPVGTMVKRVEMYYGACDFCKKLDGRVFRVTSASDPDKDGEKDVWPGKTNVGRSASPRKRVGDQLIERLPSEKWWAAAGTMHPHCRGRWEPLAPPNPDHDAEFAKWLAQKAGVKFGLPSQ